MCIVCEVFQIQNFFKLTSYPIFQKYYKSKQHFFFFRSIHSNFFTILIWTVVTPKLVLYDFRQKVFTFYFQDREYFQPRKTDEKWIQKWIRERKFQKTSENRGDSGVDDWSISGNVRYENSLSLLLAISLDRSHLFGHVLYNGSLMK